MLFLVGFPIRLMTYNTTPTCRVPFGVPTLPTRHTVKKFLTSGLGFFPVHDRTPTR